MLACGEALLFKGCLKLTTCQDGHCKILRRQGWEKYQVNESVALTSEQNKGMITGPWTSEW